MDNAVTPLSATTRLGRGPVLLIATQPGDEVLACAGALCTHRDDAETIHVVWLGTGTPATCERASQALNQLGCTPPAPSDCWNLPADQVAYGEALIQRVRAAIQQTDARLVYAPALTEANLLRRAVAMVSIEAVRRQGEKGGKCLLAQYELDTPLRPNRLLDITPMWSRKQAASLCLSASGLPGPHAEHMAALNRYRAFALPDGITAAEGYFVTDASSLNQPAAAFPGQQFHDQLQWPASANDLPLVSVMVRSADRGTLHEALDSIAVQTYPHIEIVSVNVTGKPHSPQPNWYGRFPLRFIDPGELLTRPAAANAALDAAQGEWLLFLDDDDWIEPDHISKLVKATQQFPEVLATYTGVRAVGMDKQPRPEVWDFPFDSARLFLCNFLPIHAVLFSCRVKQLGCRFDTAKVLYEDWDFWLQLSRLGTFRHVPGISAIYRLGAGQGSGAHNIEIRRSEAMTSLLRQWLPRASTEELSRFSDEFMRGLHAEKVEEGLQRVEAHRLQLANALKATELRIQNMVEDVQLKDGHITNLQLILHASLTEKDNAIGQLQHDGQTLREEVTRLSSIEIKQNELLEERQHRINEQLGTVHHQNLRLNALTHQLAQASGQLAQAQTQIAHLQTLLQQSEHQRTVLVASLSWRITQPLRSMRQGLRKFSGNP